MFSLGLRWHLGKGWHRRAPSMIGRALDSLQGGSLIAEGIGRGVWIRRCQARPTAGSVRKEALFTGGCPLLVSYFLGLGPGLTDPVYGEILWLFLPQRASGIKSMVDVKGF